MVSVVRCWKAEYQKCKHSILLYMHSMIPIICAAIFAGYYHISRWELATKISAYLEVLAVAFPFLIGIIVGLVVQIENGNVKKCAVGKHPKSEKHGNTAQFSEVERSGTQENCGGIGSGCRLRLRPLPVLRRRQSQRVARIDPNAVVVDKNIAENDRFDLFSR